MVPYTKCFSVKRYAMILLLLSCLCLVACGEDKPSKEPTKAATPTLTPMPEPTKVPVDDVPEYLKPENAREGQVSVTNSEEFTPTWERTLNEQEAAIGRGELVRIESGSELYLDADGVRETVALQYDYEGEATTFALTCGNVTITGGQADSCDIVGLTCEAVTDIYAVKLQGTKSNGFADYVQLLIPLSETNNGNAWTNFMVFAYDRVYGNETLTYLGTMALYGEIEDLVILEDGYSLTKQIPFAGTEASVFVRQKMTLCSGMTEEEQRLTYVCCEVPNGKYALQSICTTDKDIYVYAYGNSDEQAILPAGSAIACAATDGEGWFYFELCDAYESGWFCVEEVDGVAYVSAPEEVTVAEAGLFWDNP